MDLSHLLLLQIILMLCLPLLFALSAIAFSWRTTTHLGLFAAICFVCFLGLAAIAYPLAVNWLNPSLQGPATYPSAQFNVLALTAACSAAFGFPIVLRLRRVLRAT